jgi:hypothetical protein
MGRVQHYRNREQGGARTTGQQLTRPAPISASSPSAPHSILLSQAQGRWRVACSCGWRPRRLATRDEQVGRWNDHLKPPAVTGPGTSAIR